MFERYTEKARRVIFFARYEASTFGSPYIESEHLLLGLLREDKTLANRFLKSQAAVDGIRRQIEETRPRGEKIRTSVDLPLSHECKRVLAFAAEEAKQLVHKHIGTAHLLAGLMREEASFGAEMLKERGLDLATVRGWLAGDASEGMATEGGGGAWRAGPGPKPRHMVSMPVEIHAEVARRAVEHGVDVPAYLLSLVEKALHSPQLPGDAIARASALRATYGHLRERIVAEGAGWLDAGELEDEIARRKGVRRL
jgi:ATP-dependent Clp protease ATP-binding subunit ClpC